MINLRDLFRQDQEPSLQDLSSLMHSLLNCTTPSEKRRIIKALFKWIRLPIKKDALYLSPDESQHLRLKYIMQFLAREDKIRKVFFDILKHYLRRGSAVKLFSLTGMPEKEGFFSELTERIIQQFLPKLEEEEDLAELMQLIFDKEEDAELLINSDNALARILKEHEIPIEDLIELLSLDMKDALFILGAQVASLGVSRDFRQRLSDTQIIQSPFFKLNQNITNRQDSFGERLELLDECDKKLAELKKEMETSGVSVALIYQRDRMVALLSRIRLLSNLLNANCHERSDLFMNFMGHLVRELHMLSGLKDFLKNHLSLLTKRIVEHVGDKGEHYIAGSKQERRKLFIAASWAGVLTAFTAVLKFWIGVAHFPLLIEFFFFWGNYAIGFLLMQKWHLVLSSKQPSFMASALFRKFEEFKRTKKLTPVTQEIHRLSQSQLITSVANLIWVVPVAVCLDYIHREFTGAPIVGHDDAKKILLKHDPFQSLTVPYAILTGILLWLSSAIAGWTENWIAFRRIPQFIQRFSNRNRPGYWTENIPSLIGAVAGNISIAFLLSFPALIGKMLGLSLDIRHVTLAAGTMTLALSSLVNENLSLLAYGKVVLSILLIGLCNFGVSFYAALRMTAIASNVEFKHVKLFFKFLGKKSDKTDL